MESHSESEAKPGLLLPGPVLCLHACIPGLCPQTGRIPGGGPKGGGRAGLRKGVADGALQLSPAEFPLGTGQSSGPGEEQGLSSLEIKSQLCH